MSANRGNRHRWKRWTLMMHRRARYWPAYLKWRDTPQRLTKREMWEVDRLLDAQHGGMPEYRPHAEPAP